jgi:hypothetical protein
VPEPLAGGRDPRASYLRSRARSDGAIFLGFAGGIALALELTVAAGFLHSAADVPTRISASSEPPIFVALAAFFAGNGIAVLQSKALPT